MKSLLKKKFIRNPLLKLILLVFTGVGFFYVNHILNNWFSTKFHPEYKQNMNGIIRFILSTLNDSRKALENIKRK